MTRRYQFTDDRLTSVYIVERVAVKRALLHITYN